MISLFLDERYKARVKPKTCVLCSAYVAAPRARVAALSLDRYIEYKRSEESLLPLSKRLKLLNYKEQL